MQSSILSGAKAQNDDDDDDDDAHCDVYFTIAMCIAGVWFRVKNMECFVSLEKVFCSHS